MNFSDLHPQIWLNVENLGCQRGGRTIFAESVFQLNSGQALWVRGANGAGKSTLLMCLAGLLPHEGAIDWSINQATPDDRPVAQFTHVISHQNAIKPELSLLENLEFWAALFGMNSQRHNKNLRQHIADALSDAGLDGLANFRAANLSAGQKHRLSLARLILIPRPIWILDEPSAALDAQGDDWIAELIGNHLAANGLVIAATHKSITLPNPASGATKTKTITMAPSALALAGEIL